MDVSKASILTGTVLTIAIILVTVKFQKRFDGTDLATFLGVFFSGSNLPPAIFLFLYAFMDDSAALQTSVLKGYEKYISMAGIALFLISILGIWKFFKTATQPIEPVVETT